MVTFKSGYISQSVWSLFSLLGSSPFVSIHGTLNQYKFIQILDKCMIPLRSKCHCGNNELIYQDGGSGHQLSKKMYAFLYAKD